MQAIKTLFFLSLIVFGIFFSPLHAHTSSAYQLSTTYQYEDFSFTSRGMNGSIQGTWTFPEKMNLALAQETVHRFEKTETATGLWVQRHFKDKKLKQRVNAGVHYSPRFKNSKEKILPQWRSAIGYGFLPYKKMVLDADYKFANYDTANNHGFELASEWYAFPRIYFLVRWTLTATDFFQGSGWVWNNSVSIQPVIELLPEKLQLFLLYGSSREPFEAGAPGEIRSFQSDLFHFGIAAQKKQLKFRGGFEYESRSNSTFVRRTTLSISFIWQ